MIFAEGYLHIAKIMVDAANQHRCVSAVRTADGDQQEIAARLTARLGLVDGLLSCQFEQALILVLRQLIRHELVPTQKRGHSRYTPRVSTEKQRNRNPNQFRWL